MFFVYLGKNGCGKTHKLNKEYEKIEKDKIFFPCASEILSMIIGDRNKNCQGTNGKKGESKTYDNAIITLIELIFKKQQASSEKNIKSAVEKIKNASSEFKREITKKLKESFDSGDDKDEYIEFKEKLIESYVDYDIPWYSEKNTDMCFFDILNRKNKFSNENFSHGQLSFNIMKFCLKLIKKYKLKLSLFFDEPDNYLNPGLINELVDLMSSIKNDCSIYISSHNPYFITHLLNKTERKDIELYKKDEQNNQERNEWQKIKIDEKQYIVPSLLIYEIYNVCTIDLLDFYIGEIGKTPIKSNEKINNKLLYNFEGSGENDKKIVNMDPNVERVDKYFINKKDNELGYIENDEFKHFSLIHLVRNYYHHPSGRKKMMDDINKKMKKEYTNIEKLLNIAIENIRCLCDKNGIFYKLDCENN